MKPPRRVARDVKVMDETGEDSEAGTNKNQCPVLSSPFLTRQKGKKYCNRHRKGRVVHCARPSHRDDSRPSR